MLDSWVCHELSVNRDTPPRFACVIRGLGHFRGTLAVGDHRILSNLTDLTTTTGHRSRPPAASSNQFLVVTFTLAGCAVGVRNA